MSIVELYMLFYEQAAYERGTKPKRAYLLSVVYVPMGLYCP